MKRLFNLAIALLTAISVASAATTVTYGKWSATVSDDGYTTMSFNGTAMLSSTYATANYTIGTSSGSISTKGVKHSSLSQANITDEFGSGKRVTIAYTNGTATLTRIISLYDNYAIAQAVVSANNGAVIQSNNISPIFTESQSTPFSSSNKKMIFVPYDNDDYTEFAPLAFSTERTSHEVTAIFDAGSAIGYGFVVGSIDHDKWKSAIKVQGTTNNINKLQCLSGYTAMTTRDGSNPHGYVKGTNVESARYMMGLFSDWRQGMNTFADLNVIVAPRAQWANGNPMGWNSWGALKENISYDKVEGTAQWMRKNLYDSGFYGKDGNQIISLDSFSEDNINGDQFNTLKSNTEGRNQRVGFYGGLVIWEWNLYDDNGNEINWGMGSTGYNWKDVALRRNGKPIEISKKDGNAGYYAIDPTHPAVKKHLENEFARWVSRGCKYLKFDFINAAACEGDSWYDKNITTGTMAYNYGMKILHDLCEKHNIYLLESMAPIFPYRWGHGRRICCDVWSNIGESEYAMNALTWGWWTDRLYTVNDADHLVTSSSAGVTKARMTTGVCAGAFILGDDLTNSSAQERTKTYAGNADINNYIRNNLGSFMPLRVTDLSSSKNAAHLFYKMTDQYCYVAVFNYKTSALSSAKTGTILFSELGLDASKVGAIKELWSGSSVSDKTSTGFSYSVKRTENAKIYRIERTDYTAPAANPTLNWQYDTANDFIKGQRGGAIFADFNGDDHMDLYYCGESDLTHNCQPSTFKDKGLWTWQTQSNLYINRGNGTFEPRLMQYSGSSWTTPVSGIEPMLNPNYCTFDYNNDGLLDMLVIGNVGDNEGTGVKDRVGATQIGSTSYYNFTSLYKNLGNGQFERVTNIGIPNICTDRADGISMMYNMISAGDYDHDGYADVAISGCINPKNPSSTRRTTLYKNNGNGTFTQMTKAKGGINPVTLAGNVHMVDLNNDGWVDILALGEGTATLMEPKDSGNTTKIYINNEGEKFTELALSWPDFYSLRGSGSAVADFNNDGYLDLLTIGYGDYGIGYAAYIYLNTGDERIFTDSQVNLASRGYAGSEGMRVVARDFNGDGNMDFYLDGNGNQSIYLNKGDLTFVETMMQTRGFGSADGHSAVGDIDGNGTVDTFHYGYVWADAGPAIDVLKMDNANWSWGGILWKNNTAPAKSPGKRNARSTDIAQPTNISIDTNQIDPSTVELTVNWNDNNYDDLSIAYNVVLRGPKGEIISVVPVNAASGKPSITEGLESAVRPGVESYTFTIKNPGIYTPGVQALSINSDSQYSEINWADNVTGVEEITGPAEFNYSIKANNGRLTVRCGIDTGVTVYDLTGRIIAVGTTNADIELNYSGVAIVRFADISAKVAI